MSHFQFGHQTLCFSDTTLGSIFPSFGPKTYKTWKNKEVQAVKLSKAIDFNTWKRKQSKADLGKNFQAKLMNNALYSWKDVRKHTDCHFLRHQQDSRNNKHFVVLVVKSSDHTRFLKRTHNTFFLFRPATRPVQTDMRRRSTCPAGILNAFHCEIHRTLAPNSQTLQNLNQL